MKQKVALCLAITFSCVVLFNASSVSSEPTGINPSASYSATRRLRAGEESFTLLERRAPGKLRLDNMAEDQNCTFIVHFEPKEVFNICEQILVRGIPPSRYDPRREWFEVVNSTFIESEGSHGTAEDKYRATFKLTHNQIAEGHYWVRDGVMVAVRLRYLRPDGTEEQLMMRLKDIVIEAQDSAYFELPEGLTDITNNI